MLKISAMSRRGRQVVTAAAMAAVVAGNAGAATYQWSGANGTDFSDAGNWSAGGPPTATDDIWFRTNVYNPPVAPNPSNVGLSAITSINSVTTNNSSQAPALVSWSLNGFSLSLAAGVQVAKDMKIHGPGTMTAGGIAKFGSWSLNSTTITVDGGAVLNTNGGASLGGYRNLGTEVVVDGAGSQWNSKGTLGVMGIGDGSPKPYATPGKITVTNGGVVTHDLSTGQMNMKQGYTTIISADGVGSKITVNGDAGQIGLGGYNASTVSATNGGEVTLGTTGTLQTVFANTSTFTDTFNVSGGGAVLQSARWTIGGRTEIDSRGPAIANVGVGGTLKSTTPFTPGYVGDPGPGLGIAVVDKGVINLQGGTVSLQNNMYLLLRGVNSPAGTNKPTLQGFGTVDGTVMANVADNISYNWIGSGRFSPGGATSPDTTTGQITITNGNLTTKAAVDMLMQFSTEAGNPHDAIVLDTAAKTATVLNPITYSVAAGGTLTGGAGTIDFLAADALNYQGLTSGDITAGLDNLDSLLSGYTRVFGATPVGAGEYKYSIVADAALDKTSGQTLDVLRLEFAPVPEPASLGLLLAVGGLLGLRRRKRA